MRRSVTFISLAILSVLAITDPAFAQGAASEDGSGLVAIGAGLAISLAAIGGALGQGRAVAAALEAIGRNPSASGQMFTPMVLGLVFIETLVIFSFVIAFFLQGKI